MGKNSYEELRTRIETIGRDHDLQPTKDKETPQGWEPGVKWNGKDGELTSSTLFKPPTDWDPILRERGLDPDYYEVDGDNIRWCSWDGWKRDENGDTYSTICYSYKANIRLKKPLQQGEDKDLLALYRKAKKAKPVNPTKDGESTFLIALSDWQIGNPDGGGTEAQVVALAGLSDLLKKRIKALRKAGVDIGTIAIVGLGDLFENCQGFYRHQEFTVELDMRSQERVIREAVFTLISDMTPLAPRIIVGAVGGNHGEHRAGGNRYNTTKADNSDVAIFEQVYDICRANPERYGHIDWRIPNGDLAIAMELSGHHVAFTHGHVAKSKGAAMNTMWSWWEKQAHGRFYPGVADADYLVCGHFHHFNVKEQLGRTIFIAPSLTDVSDYYGDSQGVSTSPGTLTFVLSPDGWDHLSVLK